MTRPGSRPPIHTRRPRAAHLHTLPDANTWHYGYNNAGEVSTAQLKDAASTPVAQRDFAWDYDAIGNRTQFRVDGAWAVNYHPNVLNQYSQVQDVADGLLARHYDEDGNLLLHEGVGNYHWDA